MAQIALSAPNPRCCECVSPTSYMSPAERRANITKQHVPPEAVEQWNLAEPRLFDGWHAEMICHGRRDATEVIQITVRLAAFSPERDQDSGRITDMQGHVWDQYARSILGVCDIPEGDKPGDSNSGFEPSMLRVGKSLVWMNQGGERVVCRLPIVHLVVWFDNPQIDTWGY